MDGLTLRFRHNVLWTVPATRPGQAAEETNREYFMSEVYIPVRRQTEDFQAECRLLARQLKLWRQSRGLSLRKLHKLSDVPISRLSEMEAVGRADPKFTTILRIAKALEVTIPELLYGSPKRSGGGCVPCSCSQNGDDPDCPRHGQ